MTGDEDTSTPTPDRNDLTSSPYARQAEILRRDRLRGERVRPLDRTVRTVVHVGTLAALLVPFEQPVEGRDAPVRTVISLGSTSDRVPSLALVAVVASLAVFVLARWGRANDRAWMFDAARGCAAVALVAWMMAMGRFGIGFEHNLVVPVALAANLAATIGLDTSTSGDR